MFEGNCLQTTSVHEVVNRLFDAGTQNPKVSCQITTHQLYWNLTGDLLKTFATNYTETLSKSLNSKCSEMSFILFICSLEVLVKISTIIGRLQSSWDKLFWNGIKEVYTVIVKLKYHFTVIIIIIIVFVY